MPGRLPPPLELALGPDLDPEDVLAALGSQEDVSRDPVTMVERIYLDTFDGRLHAAGLILEQSASGEGLTLSTNGRRITGTGPHPPGEHVFVSEIPAGSLRDGLASVVDMRALLPQARVKCRELTASVRDRHDKTVVRLTFEQPAVVQAGRRPVTLSGHVRVRAVLGYDQAFARVSSLIASLPGLSDRGRPVVEEAILAAGGVPGGVSSKIAVRLQPDMRADEATTALCLRLVEVTEANLQGTLDDIDTEFLHDLRVAVRRSRSVLREIKGVFPSARREQARVDLRWIQEITGPTRDLDVQLLDWDDTVAAVDPRVAADLQPLHDLLVDHRAAALRTMRRQLRSRRFTNAWQAWRDLLAVPVADIDDRPNAARPIAEVAGRRILSVYTQMVRMGEAVDDDSPAEALHDLRKRGKELRYLLELFGQLWGPGTVGPMVTTMKGLQDVLGTFQDDEIQAGYLRSLAPELAEVPGGTDALIALGPVIERLGQDQRAARTAFAERFASFASTKNRRLVANTFGDRLGSP